MKYCPEIAVLHASLALIEKQACSSSWTLEPKDKREKLIRLQKVDTGKYVKILSATLGEIIQGLEEDNTKDLQELWKHQLYSLILYRVLLSNYVIETDEDQQNLSQIDITCRILPDIGISLFVELIKDLDLFSLFISALQEIDTAVSLRLLHDCITHVLTDPVDCKDVQFALLTLDWVISQLLITKGDNLPLSYTTNNEPLQITDTDQYSTMTGSGHAGLVTCMKTLLEFLNKEIEKVNEVIEDKRKSLQTLGFSYFSQIIFLGISGIFDFEQIVFWSRLNLFGHQVLTHSNINIGNKKDKLYGKLSNDGTNSKTLDVDYAGFHTLKTEFSWQQWKNCLMGLLGHKSQILKELVKSEKLLEKEIVLCGSPVSLTTTKCCGTDHIVLCNFNVLVNAFINSFSEAKICLEFSKEEILKALEDVVCHDNPDDKLKWTVAAVLWRVDNRLPGYKDGVTKLVSSTEPDVWFNEQVLHTLRSNVDVFGDEEFLLPMYHRITEISDKGSTEELKQIILKGFSLLNIELKNKHISHVYKTFGCWPMSSEEKLAIEVMSTLNKLTSDTNDQVFSEIYKLTLQDASLVLNLAVHRMINSTQQAQIIAKICCSLHTVCRLEHLDHPGRTLLGVSLHNLLTTDTLTQKELQSVIYFIQEIFKVHQTEPASEMIGTGEIISPLDVTEFLQLTILPYLNVVNLYRPSQPMKTTVAMEIAKYVHQTEPASEMIGTGEIISPLDVTEFLQLTILPYLNVVNLYRPSQPMKTTVAMEIAKYVLPLFMEADSLLANNNDIKLKVIGCISPIMICVCELFHECVILWEDQENLNQQSKVYLLENLIQFVHNLGQISEEIGCKLSDSGLAGQIDALDWTVGLRIMKIYMTKDEYIQVCQEFSASLIKNGESEDFEEGLVSMLRCVSVSEELLDTTMKNVEEILQQEGDIFISYESLIFSLVQVLPNLLTQEWLCCVDFIHMLLEHDAVNVIYRTRPNSVVPMINLQDINISLQLSQCLHDFLMLLSQSTLQSCNSAVNHCVKVYITVIKERVLARTDTLQRECAMYLLSEVFRHACAATSWMLQSSSESISVVLLDLVCMFQEINKGLSTKKQKAMLKIQREAILNDSALYISDVECRDMVFKKLEAEIS